MKSLIIATCLMIGCGVGYAAEDCSGWNLNVAPQAAAYHACRAANALEKLVEAKG